MFLWLVELQSKDFPEIKEVVIVKAWGPANAEEEALATRNIRASWTVTEVSRDN